MVLLNAEKIQSVVIVGAGQMGAGIAQVFAQHEYNVILLDQSQAVLDKAKVNIDSSLERLVKKEQVTASQKADSLKRLTFGTDFGLAGKTDLVVEAVVENFEIKKSVFKVLDGICGLKTIFASNTSSIPITQLAAVTTRPERFLGMHFMNPVPIMKLVEVISGLATSKQILEMAVEVVKSLGKEITLSKDFPGFVVNRVLMPMINEAFNILMEGTASAEDIDRGMRLGTNQPMGPLTLADFIGLDTCLSIMETLHKGFLDPKFRPSPLLVQYVSAGWMGKKSGRGVYVYL